MFDKEKWLEITDSLLRHKLRTFLTAFGVFWGIFMLIFLLGTGKGLQNGVENMFRDDALNSIWLYPGKTSVPYNGLPVGREISFNNTDQAMFIRNIPQIDHLTGRYNMWGEFSINYKQKAYSFFVRTVHPDHKYLENTLITEGRFINDIDIREKRKVACIGKVIKDEIFGDADPLGEYLEIKGVYYKVVGVFEDKGGEREMRNIYLPITTAQLLENANGRVHQWMATIGNSDLAESEKIEKKLKSIFANKYKFDENDAQAIYIRNNIEEFERFQTLFRYIRAFVWFVGLGTLFAGIMGISNIILITVKERTREIGIRKALGATPNNIVTMILSESVIITIVAGYLGLIFGLGIIELINQAMLRFKIETPFFRQPEIDLGVALSALGVMILAGLIAGWMPAREAAGIKPIEAMRADG
ncbi:MAG: ABC transporter permease [Chitinophagales bacterium]|nr:ABC transporter permease [Bacteroidota bacterium]